ncbi:hypothetical protein HI359_000238 [Escherichia coli]|uniref:hypothetical protein n=1 Tax=Escherichia coli TaxID=562 RepID=UPI0010B77F25|nr:hypothetical protein [Escherichia coli]EER5134378.1 hypothetical protein [Escherichia coli]EFK5018919.1 hypothetical protein [Escherichia coli]EGE6593503.1 hypothetical protein [Escherichia coli]GCJ47491.1 hypothetical protein BvCmsC61A_01163 [Escherichia coli]HBA3241794.1 hypothetical protein [Escherichia coli]
MSKQKGKKNVIMTIGEACDQYALNNPRKYNYEHDAEPGEELIFILEEPSPELTDEELSIIQSMDGVYFNPRPRKTTIIDSSLLKTWQCLGFQDMHQFRGYMDLNRLQYAGVTETELLLLSAINIDD